MATQMAAAIFKTALILFCVCYFVEGQCYHDSDISLTHNKPGSPHYQEGNIGRPQCIGNYSVISETTMHGYEGDSGKGIVCSRKDSMSTDGYWRNDTNGVLVDCDNYNGSVNEAYCERGSGYVTLYTPEDQDGYTNPPTNFTCCIEGLCATIRVLRHYDFFRLPGFILSDDAQLETCIIVPPSDIIAIPQQYLVQMNTSVIPFSRISSLINCTDGDGITCGQSYYTLIDLNEERYQMTVPVTWSTDSNTNTDHYYSCRIRVGGLDDNHKDGHAIETKDELVSIKTSSAPSSVSYEVVNATAINVSWSISGDVNGFIINITSDGLVIETIQLTDGALREHVINGLLLNRNYTGNYTIEVRGYYELLGPAERTTVRLEVAGISSVDSTLLTVKDISVPLTDDQPFSSSTSIVTFSVSTIINSAVSGFVIGAFVGLIMLAVVGVISGVVSIAIVVVLVLRKRKDITDGMHMHEDPNLADSSTDGIEMHDCKPYQLHKAEVPYEEITKPEAAVSKDAIYEPMST